MNRLIVEQLCALNDYLGNYVSGVHDFCCFLLTVAKTRGCCVQSVTTEYDLISTVIHDLVIHDPLT